MLRGSRLSMVLLGGVVGAVGLGLLRLAVLPPLDVVHFHANWSVWIDGKRVDLTDDRYMEDVAACSADPANITAHARVHMHEGDMDVIHVHHSGATWGHLLQNIDWGVGPGWLMTDGMDLYRDGEGGRLTYVLNGLVVPAAHDRVIGPGDRMLISFGQETPEDLLGDRFPSVSANAPEYDGNYDPAGCSGNQEETVGERVRRAFWF